MNTIYSFLLLLALCALLEWGLPPYLRLFSSNLFKPKQSSADAFYASYRRARVPRLMLALLLAIVASVGITASNQTVQIVSLIVPIVCYGAAVSYFTLRACAP